MKQVMAMVFWCLAYLEAGHAASSVLFQSRFEDKAAEWTAKGKATISTVARSPKGHSLKIVQHDDKDQYSCWVGPAIENPGESVIVSFWAADNYLLMPDESYAAGVDVVTCDEDGKPISESQFFLRAPWDPNRKASMYGIRTKDGLKWKYYERSLVPSGKAFRLKFHWPKPIIRGECYLTDIQVRTGVSKRGSSTETPGKEDEKSRYLLEISSPANGHFYFAEGDRGHVSTFNKVIASEAGL